MTNSSHHASLIKKLYNFHEKLNSSTNKTQNVSFYQEIIEAANNNSVKVKQLVAQFIPKFYKFFPDLSSLALEVYIRFLDVEDLGVRVQTIRGMPLLCSHSPDNITIVIDVLVKHIGSDKYALNDAVHKALLSLLRHNIKDSLPLLFKHIQSSNDTIRARAKDFISNKVFPLKSELLKPQEEMERYITDLVKKSLHDISSKEFWIFVDFLKSLNLFRDEAAPEHIEELLGIIEIHVESETFNLSDEIHADRLITYFHLTFPFVERGSKFLSYITKFVIPVFDQLPEERKGDLLKKLAEFSHYITAEDSRQTLPVIIQLLKKYISLRKSRENMNLIHVECLLYTFHHLAQKVPNATITLCGYKIFSGQPSDKLGDDFSECYEDFLERLKRIEKLTRASMNNKMMTCACNNILAMTKPLKSKTPSFIGDRSITLSWKLGTVSSGVKRPATQKPNLGEKRHGQECFKRKRCQ